MTDYPNAYVVGERVWLRALTQEDALGPWHTWLSDPEVAEFLNHWQANNADRQLEFYRRGILESGDLILAVCDKMDNRHIGVVSLRNIDWVHRFASIAIIIGDREARAKGILGFEAFALMVRVAFLRLNLCNLRGGYMAEQDHSRAILRALRFTEVGRYKNLFRLNGKYCDQVIVQLNIQDWLKRNPLNH